MNDNDNKPENVKWEAGEVLVKPYAAALARFAPADAEIQELVANAAPILLATDVTAKELHAARMPLKNARLAIQQTSKELKEDALTYQRAVTAEERRLIAMIEPTEDAIEARQRALEAAERERKEAAKRAALERAQAWAEKFTQVNAHLHIVDILESSDEELQAELNRATAAHQENLLIAAEENRKRLAEQEAERARVAAERAELAREREALRAEAAKVEAENARQREERAKVLADDEAKRAAERAAFEAEQAELRRELAEQKAQKLAQERAEAVARAKAERDRVAAANRPYTERVRALAVQVAGIGSELAGDERVDSALQGCANALLRYAESLERGELEVTRG